MSEPGTDFWYDLRRTTQARIGLGRAGDALPTERVLEFRLAHAVARDAVHDPLDVEALSAQVEQAGWAKPAVVASRAAGRAEYLRRPDLGRTPLDLDGVESTGADVGIVLADGLSARALSEHGAAMLAAFTAALPPELSVAPPVIAVQARVALGDHIGAALGVKTLVVMIGERPGLSVADSLGIYLTHEPRPGRSDAMRNCVSNVHPPDGLGYTTAARITAALLLGARELGRSGVDLKDSSKAPAIAAEASLELTAEEPGARPTG